MVKFIVYAYGPALQYALNYYEANIGFNMKLHYDDAYFQAASNEDGTDVDSFARHTIDNHGEVQSKKARYDELVDLCIETFNGEIAAYLRSIKLDQAKKIYTVKVVGYENRTLKILLATDSPIIP